MAMWRCANCGATKEARCKPKKCANCGEADSMVKVEKSAEGGSEEKCGTRGSCRKRSS